MADNYLITGYWGTPHVTAENDRGINAGIIGEGRFVLPVGEQFRAEYIGNNTVRIYDGKLVDNGAAAGIPAGEYVDLTVSNASQGMNRNDLIVFQYKQDLSTMVETGTFIVVQGAETSGTPIDPELTQEDLLSGSATIDQMALWRITVSTGSFANPVQVFTLSQCLSNVVNLVPISKGGTGATTAAGALKNLGAASQADLTKVAEEVAAASGWDLLWENASPNSSFAEQEINISNLTDYNLFLVLATSYASTICGMEAYMTLSGNDGVSTSNFQLMARGVKFYNTNKVKFFEGYIGYTQSSVIQKANSNLVPLKIYGIKGVTA